MRFLTLALALSVVAVPARSQAQDEPMTDGQKHELLQSKLDQIKDGLDQILREQAEDREKIRRARRVLTEAREAGARQSLLEFHEHKRQELVGDRHTNTEEHATQVERFRLDLLEARNLYANIVDTMSGDMRSIRRKFQ